MVEYKHMPLDKEPLYKLCNFLSQARLNQIGIDNPISIPLHDFGTVFPDAQELSGEQIERIKTEIKRLAAETLVKLVIQNPEIIDNFEDNFKRNLPISLSYQRQNIEDYINRLRTGDIRIEEGADFDRLIFNHAKKQFEYQGKIMKVRKNEKTKSIRLNICLLLYGKPLTYLTHDGEETDIYDDRVHDDYEPGDPVHFDTVKNFILVRGELTEIRNASAGQFKQITDAISDLNEDAESKLNIKIFNYEDQEVWLARP